VRLIFRFPVVTLGTLFASILLSQEWVSAEPVCDSVYRCRKKRTLVEERIRELDPQLAPYMMSKNRKKEWLISEMNYYQAKDLCEGNGTTLPSIRQLALVLNPKGVHLTKPEDCDEAVQTIYKTDGSVDFYYDPRTYIRDRELDQGRKHKKPSIKIVSSTTSPEDSRSVYFFHLEEGRIYIEKKRELLPWRNESVFAVRCLGL